MPWPLVVHLSSSPGLIDLGDSAVCGAHLIEGTAFVNRSHLDKLSCARCLRAVVSELTARAGNLASNIEAVGLLWDGFRHRGSSPSLALAIANARAAATR